MTFLAKEDKTRQPTFLISPFCILASLIGMFRTSPKKEYSSTGEKQQHLILRSKWEVHGWRLWRQCFQHQNQAFVWKQKSHRILKNRGEKPLLLKCTFSHWICVMKISEWIWPSQLHIMVFSLFKYKIITWVGDFWGLLSANHLLYFGSPTCV